MLELLPPLELELPGTPGTPLIGCPAAVASLATATIAAWARSVLDFPAGGLSAAAALVAAAGKPSVP